MARAIWKGRITFGSVDVPVKLYSAVQDRSVSFRLLDAEHHEPVVQHMVDPETGKIVEHAEIRRAFEAESGELVVLDDDELEELEPKASRRIEIKRFVPPSEITHQWYVRPYYLGPDGPNDEYFALVEALRKQKVEGVAKWVMRKKSYVGALRTDGDHLSLITLRHADEVVAAAALEPPAGRDLSKREVDMARQLVAAMEGELDVAAFKDEYRERVLELVEAKAAGKVVKFPKAPAKKAGKSLVDTLERSLEQRKKRRASA